MSKAPKRKRLESSQSASKKRKIQKAARLGPIVRGDALKWKEVTLPDRLDDAEGFYGLEEIDDVEILKDENGQLTFRPKSGGDVIVGEGEIPGEEWEGFDDDESDHRNGVKHPQTAPTTALKVEKASKDANSSTKQKAKKDKNAVKAPAVKPVLNTPTSTDLEDQVGFDALNGAEPDLHVDVTAWKDLGLSPDVLAAISRLRFSEPTPIQKGAIPPIQEGRDVIGKAVTGSGKTLAFGLPIVERWLEAKESQGDTGSNIPTAFILAPTRELAHQLSKHLTALCQGLQHSPRVAAVTGGLAVVKQQRQLERADVIIGTPGRLWEVINSSHGLIERLKQIQFLVIDEADRLLSEGHFKEVEEILNVLDRKITNDTEIDGEQQSEPASTMIRQRQTLVFSATFHKGLQQKLASKQRWHPNDLLSNSQSLEYLLQKLRFQQASKPTFVDANPTESMAENLSESVLECAAMQKDLFLYSLLLLHQHQHEQHLRSRRSLTQGEKITRTLVFTNSISTVKRLVSLLSTLAIPGTSVLPLHSSMPQKSRLRSLERFSSPSLFSSVLIATDVAARGLDIKGVHTVIHYHVPRSADMYVHRSGRTARALASGKSILICSPDEVAGVTRLISKIHSSSSSSSSTSSKTATPTPSKISPMTLPASLPTQLSTRVSLAQKISTTVSSTTKSKSEDAWLRRAADDLGVDFSADEFESNAAQMRRGRGTNSRKKPQEEQENGREKMKVAQWKTDLKRDIDERRVDFGDGYAVGTGKKAARFLAGGAVDVDRLLSATSSD